MGRWAGEVAGWIFAVGFLGLFLLMLGVSQSFMPDGAPNPDHAPPDERYASRLDGYLHEELALRRCVDDIGDALDEGDVRKARQLHRDAEKHMKALEESAKEVDLEASQWIPQPVDDQRDNFRPYPQ